MINIQEKDLKKLFKDKIDKSDWKLWKFSDLVENIIEKVVPKNSVLEHYIGLEHLDSGSLHINRFGETASLIGDKLKIYKGDLIFAKRNAYLKRVAIAKSDAVASAHSLVLRAKPKNVLPEFLPFLMLSEVFWERAIEISVGSLSPTINWKVLAKQEFLLPPKDQQKKLAELLWAMDDVIEKEREVMNKIINTKHSLRKEVFKGYDLNLLKNDSLDGMKCKWEIDSIKNCCEVLNNLRLPINKEMRETMKGKYPYYGPTSILSYISEYRIEGEHVLIGEDGDHFLKYNDWEMTQFVTGKFNVNNHAHILKGTDRCMTKWIFYSLQHRNIIPHLSKQGATRYKLNKESLLDILLLIPSIDEQKALISKFDIIEKNLKEIQKKIASSQSLQKSLINQIF